MNRTGAVHGPMRLWRLPPALAVCVMALWPAPAGACTCFTADVCDAAWTAEAVFVGHVVSIESSPVSGLIVHLAVAEGFRGFRLTQVAVTTSSGGASCGYGFQIGESYLVYAHRASQGGPLTVSLCSRTRPLADAADDLAYLRSISAIVPGSLARIPGQVVVSEWPPPGREPTPMPGVTVTARGGGRVFSTETDARGHFELSGLPVTAYALDVTAPAGYASLPARTIAIHDPRGCGTTRLYVRYDSRVAGRVVDARGAGVGGLPLDLVARTHIGQPEGGGTRVQARTAADGTFELQLVAPGEYVLGFNFLPLIDRTPVAPQALYPGVTDASGASSIVVAIGQRVRLTDFTLPDAIRLVTIRGTVVDEAGRPVPEASVGIHRENDGSDSAGPVLITGADGRFALTVAEGGRYSVYASRELDSTPPVREIRTGRHTFTAAPGLPDATIVLRPRQP